MIRWCGPSTSIHEHYLAYDSLDFILPGCYTVDMQERGAARTANNIGCRALSPTVLGDVSVRISGKGGFIDWFPVGVGNGTDDVFH